MSVTILVGDDAVKRYKNRLQQYKFNLDIRKTLGGDFAIYDHHEVDIVLMPKINKIVAFAKDSISDLVYDTQSRFFDYLMKKGIVDRDSVQAGNVYASLQGKMEPPSGEGIDAVQVALFAIAKFIEEERPRYEYLKKMEEEEEERLTEPTDEESSDLGDVPHAREKGSIRPGIYYQNYMYDRNYVRE